MVTNVTIKDHEDLNKSFDGLEGLHEAWKYSYYINQKYPDYVVKMHTGK